MTNHKRIATFFLSALLLTAVGCASTSDQSSTGEYIDDSVITSKVKTAIFNDPGLKVLQINVETYKNVVQLSGFVSSKDEKSKANDVALSVPGVRSVSNDLKVK